MPVLIERLKKYGPNSTTGSYNMKNNCETQPKPCIQFVMHLGTILAYLS